MRKIATIISTTVFMLAAAFLFFGCNILGCLGSNHGREDGGALEPVVLRQEGRFLRWIDENPLRRTSGFWNSGPVPQRSYEVQISRVGDRHYSLFRRNTGRRDKTLEITSGCNAVGASFRVRANARWAYVDDVATHFRRSGWSNSITFEKPTNSLSAPSVVLDYENSRLVWRRGSFSYRYIIRVETYDGMEKFNSEIVLPVRESTAVYAHIDFDEIGIISNTVYHVFIRTNNVGLVCFGGFPILNSDFVKLIIPPT